MSSQDICSICELQPEDILILQCRHHLCIGCASEIYSLNGKGDKITCQICLTDTLLDPETIKCLKASMIPIISHSNLPPKPPIAINHKSNDICNEHQEKCVYYCFDCQTFKICPQCILTNQHNNHKVLTIKKALKSISKQINENWKTKQSVVQKLTAKKTNAVHHRDVLINENEDRKASLKQIFDEIVKIISEKYSKLTNSLQDYSKRNIEILDGYIQSLNQKIQFINQSIHFERNLLNTDNDCQILDYFDNLKDDLNNRLNQIQLPYTKEIVLNGQSVVGNIRQILDNFMCQQQKSESVSKDFSIIEKGRLDRSGYRENEKSRISNQYSHTKKLQLSRSINNATNIINKLQSRMKNQS